MADVKQWWTMADTYGVEVLDSVDHVLVLACTVVVDLGRRVALTLTLTLT